MNSEVLASIAADKIIVFGKVKRGYCKLSWRMYARSDSLKQLTLDKSVDDGNKHPSKQALLLKWDLLDRSDRVTVLFRTGPTGLANELLSKNDHRTKSIMTELVGGTVDSKNTVNPTRISIHNGDRCK